MLQHCPEMPVMVIWKTTLSSFKSSLRFCVEEKVLIPTCQQNPFLNTSVSKEVEIQALQFRPCCWPGRETTANTSPPLHPAVPPAQGIASPGSCPSGHCSFLPATHPRLLSWHRAVTSRCRQAQRSSSAFLCPCQLSLKK